MANFFSLPRELHDQIYGLCLLHYDPPNPLDPWIGCNYRQDLTLGLLRVSKTVHREAGALFYCQNCFKLTTPNPDDLASFLITIGHNADYIRHICVNFPDFLHLDPGNVTLEDSHVAILANIHNSCANLRTITTSLYSTITIELKLDALYHPKIVTEALQLVDNYFRATSSLQEIIVELYEDGPNDDIRRQMERLGWILSITENPDDEEYDMRWRWIDFDDDCNDDYHIDNDSDFWRRAAD